MPKLAIISTPRSGNTWLRYLLSHLYDLQQVAVHDPDAINWQDLPEHCALQIHWHRTDKFCSRLEEHGFQPVVISRHPFDVLLSILQFAPWEPETRLWLLGEGGDEQSIHHKSPTSDDFLQYATGPRARALLSVTPEWLGASKTLSVRYEDLVSDTEVELTRLSGHIGTLKRPVAEAVQRLTLERLQPTSRNNHFWKGQPGLWKHLIPAELAARIFNAHRDLFVSLGYHSDADELLNPDEANRRWKSLT